MQIDISQIDRGQFLVKEGLFAGRPAVLITPALQGTIWTQANKHLRSSVWSIDGHLLSAGFAKFPNADENPEHFPMPAALSSTDCIVSKLDGSLCILDWVGYLSMRMRDTFTYAGLDNAADFEHVLQRYPILNTCLRDYPNVSLLTEITTPNQRIILDYGPEPDLWLIGAVNKDDYSLLTQDRLDMLGVVFGLKRPKRWTFNSLEECRAVVTDLKDEEGVVLYSGPRQSVLHKIKATSYVLRHRFKERATLPNTLEIWFKEGKPDPTTFRANLIKTFDYESMQMVSDYVTNISLAWELLSNQLADLALDIEPLKNWSRRDAALKIQADYLAKGLASAAFQLLSNRPVDDKTVRRLMEARLGI